MSSPRPIGSNESEAEARSGRVRSTVTLAPAPMLIELGTAASIVRPLKTSERVARDIVDDIIQGGLHTGDSLPSEAEMLVQYGVSRESLREGLRLLEVQGMITIRRGPGGGPIVGTVDAADLGRMSTLYFHMAGATYAELFEAWQFAEGEMAERAAKHPDVAARRAAMEPYLQPQGARDVDVGAHLEMHSRFHGALASLVNNRVLELTLRSYGQIVSHHVVSVDDPRRLHDQIGSDHAALAAAVVAGHSRRARELMDVHIEHMIDGAIARFGDRTNDLIDWQ